MKKPEILYPEIAKEIEQMLIRDQEMRKAALEDPEKTDVELDRAHTARMKEIIEKIGWPTISKVGAENSQGAWLLVQHADLDVTFQQQCLEMMKALPEEEITRNNIAYLEDRVRVNSNQSQMYGTQFVEENGKFIPRPIEEPETINERRKAMGLTTLEEGIKHMEEKYRQFNKK